MILMTTTGSGLVRRGDQSWSEKIAKTIMYVLLGGFIAYAIRDNVAKFLEESNYPIILPLDAVNTMVSILISMIIVTALFYFIARHRERKGSRNVF